MTNIMNLVSLKIFLMDTYVQNWSRVILPNLTALRASPFEGSLRSPFYFLIKTIKKDLTKGPDSGIIFNSIT